MDYPADQEAAPVPRELAAPVEQVIPRQQVRLKVTTVVVQTHPAVAAQEAEVEAVAAPQVQVVMVIKINPAVQVGQAKYPVF